MALCFLSLLMIVLLVPAVQSAHDVTYVSEVDSIPLGMCVATYYVTYNKRIFSVMTTLLRETTAKRKVCNSDKQKNEVMC